MQKWWVALGLSLCICGAGVTYFLRVIAFDACLNAGGKWLGPSQGCLGGNNFTPDVLLNPVSIAIFMGLVLGIASALIQFYTLGKNITGFVSQKTKS